MCLKVEIVSTLSERSQTRHLGRCKHENVESDHEDTGLSLVCLKSRGISRSATSRAPGSIEYTRCPRGARACRRSRPSPQFRCERSEQYSRFSSQCLARLQDNVRGSTGDYTQDLEGGVRRFPPRSSRRGWGTSCKGSLRREYETPRQWNLQPNLAFQQKRRANIDTISKFDERVSPLVKIIDGLPDMQDCSPEFSQQLKIFKEYALLPWKFLLC